MLSTVFGGFLLINHEYQDSLDQAKESALENNKTMYTYLSATGDMLGSSSARYSLEQFIDRLASNENEIFLGEFSEIKNHLILGSAENLDDEEYQYCYVTRNDVISIQVISKYKTQYIITYQNISDLMATRDQNYHLYRNIIIVSSIIIAAILYAFVWYITRPLNNVTKMAEKFSSGDYSVRINSSYEEMKSLELEQLGSTFNQMANNLENYISEVELAAKRKEDFVGNFTHELKTPMTSIIGYADLLRTYNLPADKSREYSNYIYNEAKRIESLSANLLQLIVMQKKDFPFEIHTVTNLLEQIKTETHFLGEKYGVNIQFDYEDGCISGEKSLLIVAIKNLIDNACKASKANDTVIVYGRKHFHEYHIIVKDFGVGIPKEEIEHILEPFYMVDKSRSRKQGGAGLGLSLTKQIVDLHHGTMQIESLLEFGTKITLSFPLAEGGALNEK